METNFRQQQIQIVLNRFMLGLSCSSSVAESLLSHIEGLKIQGIPASERLGYMNQLLYKLGIHPSESRSAVVRDQLESRSILCDIPDNARQFCNQVFPFIGALTYSLSSSSQESNLLHGALVPARHRPRVEPTRDADFYFVEQNMPQRFFVMAHNSKLPIIMEHGISAGSIRPTTLWPSKLEAQDSFLGGLDGLHVKSPSLTGWGGMNDSDKGTLVSVNSSFVVRDPTKFYPVHRMGIFISMAYSLDLPAEALSVESLVEPDAPTLNSPN